VGARNRGELIISSGSIKYDPHPKALVDSAGGQIICSSAPSFGCRGRMAKENAREYVRVDALGSCFASGFFFETVLAFNF
jgi:hypothetical protein